MKINWHMVQVIQQRYTCTLDPCDLMKHQLVLFQLFSFLLWFIYVHIYIYIVCGMEMQCRVLQSMQSTACQTFWLEVLWAKALVCLAASSVFLFKKMQPPADLPSSNGRSHLRCPTLRLQSHRFTMAPKARHMGKEFAAYVRLPEFWLCGLGVKKDNRLDTRWYNKVYWKIQLIDANRWAQYSPQLIFSEEIIKKIGEVGFNFQIGSPLTFVGRPLMSQDGFDMEEFKAQVYKAQNSPSWWVTLPDAGQEGCKKLHIVDVWTTIDYLDKQ